MTSRLSHKEGDISGMAAPDSPPAEAPDPHTQEEISRARSKGLSAVARHEESVRRHIDDLQTERERHWAEITRQRDQFGREIHGLQERLDTETQRLREEHQSGVSRLRAELDLEVKTYRSEYERIREAAAASSVGNLVGNLLIAGGGTLVSAAGYYPLVKDRLIGVGCGAFVSGVLVSFVFTIGALIKRIPPRHARAMLNAARAVPPLMLPTKGDDPS